MVVRVQQFWHYICMLVNLFNREIFGNGAGPRKDAQLIRKAFASVTPNLKKIQMFHTDRGSEFKNKLIDEALQTFGIQRSINLNGSPYDNDVAETVFKVIITEFVKGAEFESLAGLDIELFD